MAARLLAQPNLSRLTQRRVEAVLREALGEPGAAEGVALPDQYRAVITAFLAVEVAPRATMTCTLSVTSTDSLSSDVLFLRIGDQKYDNSSLVVK